jgi:hypothetical protein
MRYQPTRRRRCPQVLDRAAADELALAQRLARREALCALRDRALAALLELPPRQLVPLCRLARQLGVASELLHAAAETYPAYLRYASGTWGTHRGATLQAHPHLDERLANEHVRQHAIARQARRLLGLAPR